MKIGIAMFPADFAVRPDELARMVEARGFESLWLPEHPHLPATPSTVELLERAMGAVPAHMPRLHDLFVALSFAASATTTLKLGTGICLVAERDPILTAKTVATLDVLSGGRVLLGVDAGWIPEETANHGVEPRRRWAVMGERVRAMQEIWTHERAEFHGEHVDFDAIWSWPKPVQQPRVPVLVGGEGRGVLGRVIEYGDEWMPHDNQPLDVLAARITELQDAARTANREPVPVTLYGASADLEQLRHLAGLGVHRAIIYAPPAGADEVRGLLDDVAPLAEAVA
jgi:probable F420-dependent oxidoreductase